MIPILMASARPSATSRRLRLWSTVGSAKITWRPSPLPPMPPAEGPEILEKAQLHGLEVFRNNSCARLCPCEVGVSLFMSVLFLPAKAPAESGFATPIGSQYATQMGRQAKWGLNA